MFAAQGPNAAKWNTLPKYWGIGMALSEFDMQSYTIELTKAVSLNDLIELQRLVEQGISVDAHNPYGHCVSNLSVHMADLRV